jgi:uncharacterized protein
MRILVDIVHPADVHFFKYAMKEWCSKGYKILITARNKDITLQLLKAYEFEFTLISSQGKGLLAMAYELAVRNIRLCRIALRFQPDVLIGFSGISVSHVGKLLNIPSIVFYDTEFARLSNALTYPLASVVCTPDCYDGQIGRKHIRFQGYKDLAYLHPARFTPNSQIMQEAGIHPVSRFFIVRFVSWEAAHDVGEKGFSYGNKVKFVRELSKYGQVFISSEGSLPIALSSYRLPISIDRMHDLMAFSHLYVGESATMASECAVLGVPAIYISTTGRGYTTEQEQKYGLVFNFTDEQQDKAFEKMQELLMQSNLREEWLRRRERMLLEKIDVTAWIVKFIEDYVLGLNSTVSIKG